MNKMKKKHPTGATASNTELLRTDYRQIGGATFPTRHTNLITSKATAVSKTVATVKQLHKTHITTQ